MLTAGQVLWKIGLKEASMSSFSDIIRLMFNKYIFSGIVIYAIATFYWLSVLKKFDLIKVYPLQSMSYIIVLIFGVLLLKEPLTKNTLIGTIVIIIGVFIITKQ